MAGGPSTRNVVTIAALSITADALATMRLGLARSWTVGFVAGGILLVLSVALVTWVWRLKRRAEAQQVLLAGAHQVTPPGAPPVSPTGSD